MGPSAEAKMARYAGVNDPITSWRLLLSKLGSRQIARQDTPLPDSARAADTDQGLRSVLGDRHSGMAHNSGHYKKKTQIGRLPKNDTLGTKLHSAEYPRPG